MNAKRHDRGAKFRHRRNRHPRLAGDRRRKTIGYETGSLQSQTGRASSLDPVEEHPEDNQRERDRAESQGFCEPCRIGAQREQIDKVTASLVPVLGMPLFQIALFYLVFPSIIIRCVLMGLSPFVLIALL